MKKKLLFLISIMLIITAVAGFITILSAPKQKDTLYQDDGNIHLVTTFYPVYIIALNLTDQVPRITLKNLTDMKTGCLEDYQMTTENMKILNSAEVLMLNGGGIESFLSDTLKNYPNLPVIDLSKGITMLQEDYYDKKLIISDANTSSDISQTLNAFTGYNPHVWLNPQNYILQIDNMKNGLIKYVNSRTDLSQDYIKATVAKIEENANVYTVKVKKVDRDIEESLVPGLKIFEQNGGNDQVVIFHDAFAYLADRIGLKVAYSVGIDADTQLSAVELADIIDIVKKDKIQFLFSEKQYGVSVAKRIADETDAKVYVIDSAVTGDGTKDSYLNSMENNIAVIRKALQ